MAIDLKVLIEKLNTVCRKALETAAQLSVAQTNFNVEIEHMLLKLLELDGTDMQQILRYFEVDPADTTSNDMPRRRAQ